MAALGVLLLPRLERMRGAAGGTPQSRLLLAGASGNLPPRRLNSNTAGTRAGSNPTPNSSSEVWSPPESGRAPRFGPFSKDRGRGGIPQLLDIYLLRSFLYYFLLLTVGFILLFEVFTFFELLDDIAQHRTRLLEVAQLFHYLASYLFYQLAPLAPGGCAGHARHYDQEQ